MSEQRIVNFYTVRPDELKPGDVLVATVVLHIVESPGYPGLRGRVYRCGYPPETYDGIPQGTHLGCKETDEVINALFPVARNAGVEYDW